MAVNNELRRVSEWRHLRGFNNLFHKENLDWWSTSRWWINALLWPILLCGLVSIMFFVLPSMARIQTTDEVIAAGGPVAYAIQVGISVFFRMGSLALALGVIILSQDLILNEQQTGVTEWLLSKPMARRSYILAKLASSTMAILVLLVGLPSLLMYGLLSIRVGVPYAPLFFLKAVGILTIHTLFYLILTIMLGTFFQSRIAILGIALVSAVGGVGIGGLVKPLLYITPWILGSSTEKVALGQATTLEMVAYPLIASALWCVIFIVVTLVRFDKREF